MMIALVVVARWGTLIDDDETLVARWGTLVDDDETLVARWGTADDVGQQAHDPSNQLDRTHAENTH